MKRQWWNSISWKLVFVYFVLVFIATSILGVFIIDRMNDYFMESIRRNIERTVKQGEMISAIAVFDDMHKNSKDIQKIVDSWGRGLKEELYIIDKDMLVVASNNVDADTISINNQSLNEDLIIEGLLGKEAYVDGYSPVGRPVKNMVFPVKKDNKISGILYIRSDMTSTYAALDKAKGFFIKAMIIAITVTVLVGLFIAKGITAPIRRITLKARNMAKGNFGDKVKVEGTDEIGELGDALNFLDNRIGTLLTELSGEKIKLEAILRNLSSGVIVINMEGILVHVNQEAKQILGIKDEEIIGRDYDETIKHFSEELLLEKIKRRCSIIGCSDLIEYKGKIFDIRYDRYKDEEGEEGVILLLQDITERQKLERVQMDFVANVSHELKTPLTTIKSYSETLLDSGSQGDNGEISEQFLGIINEEADRMSRMVKELLELSRLDNKLVNWNFKIENVVDILESTTKKMELVAKKKDLQVNRIYKADKAIRVLVDKDKLEQVFINLISNAIKYTDEGKRIDIDVYEENKKAIIVIRDTGIGIPQESLSRVFERFYCVDKARTRSQGGTGLGLPISKQIIEQMDGTIDIESRPGEGTKVIVKLKLVPTRGTPNIE